MGEYKRSTRECTLEDMRPELKAAINEHIERDGLEDVIDAAIYCCETVSTREKKKLFGSKTEVEISSAVLTPKWLITAGGREKGDIGVLSARLQELRIQDYEKTKMYAMMADTGLDVYGFPSATGPASVFIGLGPEPAAQRLREMLKEAMAKV